MVVHDLANRPERHDAFLLFYRLGEHLRPRSFFTKIITITFSLFVRNDIEYLFSNTARSVICNNWRDNSAESLTERVKMFLLDQTALDHATRVKI